MKIGLHIRLGDTMYAVAQRALELELPFFQTFVLNCHGKFFVPTERDEKKFLAVRDKFGALFLHSSYWINSASATDHADRLLERELALARQLAFNYYILHPGAAQLDQPDRFVYLVSRLRQMSKRYPDVTILLENVAHARSAIGGSMGDLGCIARKLEDCPNIGFCIDTAHAHSYGYSFDSIPAVDQFFALVDREVGLERVRLIHLNNTHQVCGSRIDIHSVSTRGLIDSVVLRYLVNMPMLSTAHFIAELPTLSPDKEKAILALMRDW